MIRYLDLTRWKSRRFPLTSQQNAEMIKAGVTKYHARTGSSGHATARRSVLRSSMDAGITGGLTLFGPTRKAK